MIDDGELGVEPGMELVLRELQHFPVLHISCSAEYVIKLLATTPPWGGGGGGGGHMHSTTKT